MGSRMKQMINVVLCVALVAMSVPAPAFGSIRELPDGWAFSATNPSDISDPATVWREGWGNKPLVDLRFTTPVPDEGEPAITGAKYFLMRPFTSYSTTLPPWPWWQDAENAPLIPGQETWNLKLDVPTVYGYWSLDPSLYPLFDPTGVYPSIFTSLGVMPNPAHPYEGPYGLWVQYVAKDTTDAAAGAVFFGLDMTPPKRVEDLTVTLLPEFIGDGGWYKQSSVRLRWRDMVYDDLAGTGYFELFLDGLPYPTEVYPYPTDLSNPFAPADWPSTPVTHDTVGRRVYDWQEHFPGYGTPIPTARRMTIEDLPPGEHYLQIRAVDRAQNKGPLSAPVTVRIDPDVPSVRLSAPAASGQVMGARPTFSAEAADCAGIREVGFYLSDGTSETLVASDTAPPYSASVTTPLAHGSRYTVRAVAVDLAGRSRSDEREFIVDNRPMVSIVAPVGTETVGRLVPVKVLASDLSGVGTITVSVDGGAARAFAFSDEPSAAAATTLWYLPAGSHTASVTVHNIVGITESRTVSFTVSGSVVPDPARMAVLRADGTDDVSGGWVNDAMVPFTAPPEDGVTAPAELVYRVDRDPMTTIDLARPWLYERAYDGGSPHIGSVIDLAGVYAADASLDGRAQMPGMASDPLEGIWYVHSVVGDGAGSFSGTRHTVYGVDLTPPGPISDLGVYTSTEATVPLSSGAAIAQRRVVVRWDASEVDALSGTAGYRVWVDDELLTMVPFRSGSPTASVTLEDLGEGRHEIAVAAVDRAGNEGPRTEPFVLYVDSADPTVSITAPAFDGARVGLRATFSADATDASGIREVRFLVDGSLVATDTSSPYEAQVDLGARPDGSVSTLTVEAVDAAGKVARVSRPFTIANRPDAGIEFPENGARVPRFTALRVRASDPSGVARIDVVADGLPVFSFGPASEPTSTTFVAPVWLASGSHDLTVTVTNTTSGSTVLTRTVTADPELPPALSALVPYSAEDGGIDLDGGWFNTPYPPFTARPPAGIGDAGEMLYRIDRSPTTTIDPARPWEYDIAVRQDGATHLSGVIDQRGVLLSDPLALDGAAQMPGPGVVSDPIEGVWYAHALIRGAGGSVGAMTHAVYGIDLTPPSVVPSVSVYSDSRSETPATGWLDQSRVVVKWSGAQVDALSGVARYVVYLDGVALADASVPFEQDRPTMSLTIEDLSPGAHTIEVAAVDRAGNVGPRAAAVARIKSVPTIRITSPAADGVTLMTPTPVRADVSDAAGLAAVTASLDETPVVIDLPVTPGAKTYSVNTYIPYLSDDTTYTLRIRATSVSGPSVEATRTFKVDTSLPPEVPVEPEPEPDDQQTPEVTVPFRWFNTRFPTFRVAPAAESTMVPTELLYLVDRTSALETGAIDPLLPNAYYTTFRVVEGASHMTGVIDQVGVYLTDPVRLSGDATGSPTQGKVDEPYEGIWYLHASVRYGLEPTPTVTPPKTVAYGVDVTPPPRIPSVAAYLTTATPAPAWIAQNRVVIRWASVNDRLSGTHRYNVYIDGAPLDAGEQGILHQQGRATMSLTIEDLAPGVHEVRVSAVDLAGNEGPLSDPVIVGVDLAAPSVAIVEPPASVATLGVEAAVSAVASDDAGIADVTFAIPGAGSVIDTAAPYAATFDLSGVLDGSPVTLTVTATDLSGRSTIEQRAFTVVNRPEAAILSPPQGSACSRLVPFKVTASDPTGIAWAVLEIDGGGPVAIPVAPGARSLIHDVVSYLAPGSRIATLTVRSASGNTTVATATFTVSADERPELADFRTRTAGPYDVVSTWFRTAKPTFTVLPPSSLPDATHMLYTVDRSPSTSIDPSRPFDYDVSYRDGTTHLTGVIDLAGYVAQNPALDLRAAQPEMLASGVEGIWYAHALMRDALGSTGPLQHTVFGVDLTPPTAVSGLAVYASAQSPAPVASSEWLDQSRIVIKWRGGELDALSGVSHYQVYLDDRPLPGAVPASVDQTVTLTIEDLSPGVHQVGVAAVDKAGNEGPRRTVLARIVSVPTVLIQSPQSDDATLASPAPLRARVMDAAGIDRVVFSIDETPVARTFTPASADTTTMVCAMYAPLSTGTYTLRVTAYSVSGPSSVVTRRFNVDASLPPEVPPPDDGGGDDTPVVTPTFTWFNTAFPSFTAKPGAVPTNPTELLYLVDRTPITPIVATDPNAYHISTNLTETTTFFNGVIDQRGVYLSDPAAFDGFLQMPARVSDPIEGIWYVHALIRNALGEASDVVHVGYGVDITPPLPVTGVGVFRSLDDTQPVTGWLDQSRVVIRWNSTERDALSGTAFFRVYVDGHVVGADGMTIGFQPGRDTMSITIEDLPPGAHTIRVSAVDRAGNEGPLSAPAYARIDVDAPRAQFKAPARDGAAVGTASTLSVVATDGAGIESVTFLAGSRVLGMARPSSLTTDFTATIRPDWSGVPEGQVTVTARVVDVGGHSASATRVVVLDKTPPAVTVTASGPSPFYPRLRDGYRDYFTVRLQTSEAGTARLVVKDSGGRTVRTVTRPVTAGATSIRWDGKRSDGSVRAGTYTWTLRVTDRVGNTSAPRTGRATIRTYEIVRLSSGAVRVIER